MLHMAAAYYPHKSAINFYDTNIDYQELREQVLRLANALGKLGVKKGERVGIALPNCPQCVIAHYATLSLGAIIVNLNPFYTFNELKFMMEDTTLETLITIDTAMPVMRPLALELGLKRVIVTRLTDYINKFDVSTAASLNLEKGWHHFSSLIGSCTDKSIPPVSISPRDPAMIQFTGGTTGLPKGALLSHANVISATYTSCLWGSTFNKMSTPDSRNILCVIPYFHIYGIIVGMNWAIYNCATQVLLHRFDLEELFGIIKKVGQFTYFPAVPTMITAILNHPDVEKMNLGARFMMLNSGGAPLPTELVAKIRNLGLQFIEGYGMSESTSMGISNPMMGLCKAGSIGIPVPNMDVRLVDLENGVDEVQPGEPGEIVLKGPTIMQGYWNKPEETEKQLVDGWLHTGDIARTDEDGYFYIVDRKKDMIIAGGFNIYPREIDEVLYQHPKVREAIAVGIPDEYRGETVKAFIVLKPGQRVTDKEIIDFCKAKLAAYKVPRKVEFRTELPKSAAGKLLRKILRDEEINKQK